MLTAIMWIVLVVLSLTMLTVLLWLLFLRGKNLLEASGRAADLVTSALDQAPTQEELIQQGKVSEPRAIDAGTNAQNKAMLRTQLAENRNKRSARKIQKRSATYQQWDKYFK